ncbi:uncharacterized protein L203_104688 [Cryptococcus depauperatus CBS 7841]|uniref:Uncharacterized protein n=1 Tax=Cryptococcus depauperatus CBS 7841 TaxID=1295531 RepID=A0A1E3ILB3_9TREE|nr:hypothetical protein L203_02103 [Cryptococcus depauperatus CBS 7841]
MVRSASFTDLMDALKLGKSKSKANTLAPPGVIIPRPKSSIELHHTANARLKRGVREHLESLIIKRILSFCDDHTLAQCLRVSRLFFHLAGCILYTDLAFFPYDFFPILKGSSAMEEAMSGKVLVGRKKFKDRLLKHVGRATIYSHDDMDDSEHACQGPQELCPPLALCSLMPRLRTLRIVLANAYDYHTTFCSRYPHHCPLLFDLAIEKLVILGARSPLPVLPLAFPNKTSSSTTPIVNTENLPVPVIESLPSQSALSLQLGHAKSSSLSLVSLAKPKHPIIKSHSRTPSAISLSKQLGPLPTPAPPPAITHSPRLPPLCELTIVMPTGLSYDAKDYQPYSHCFRHKKTMLSLQRLTIVFYVPRESCEPWKTAFYDARRGNSWTSYLNLADDLASAALAVPLQTFTTIVGTENLDGELLNMGVNVMRERRVGEVMQNRVISRIETKWRAEGGGSGETGTLELREKIDKVNFVRFDEWLEGQDGADVEGWDLEEWSK